MAIQVNTVQLCKTRTKPIALISSVTQPKQQFTDTIQYLKLHVKFKCHLRMTVYIIIEVFAVRALSRAVREFSDSETKLCL